MSEDNDVFVTTPNRRKFFFPENCSEIEDVLKFESLEACKGKQVAFGWLGQPKKTPKFKLSISGKKNVRLLGVMTKTSVLSAKNVPIYLKSIH